MSHRLPAFLAAFLLLPALPLMAQRPWPDTSRGVCVFNDQLIQGMSDEQVAFCATHYAGTQKMRRSEADRLRAVNPEFLILHYRLGLGLGYRASGEGCAPTGDWLHVVEGDDWVQEWPGDGAVQENWFFHWPEASAQRVYQCTWGWYLVNPEDASWRTWWSAELERQLAANDDDGLFLDSFNVPNYMGGDTYQPHLPDVDEAFETAWSNRIRDWIAWLRARFAGTAWIVPNVGGWITSRDVTDYSPADGLMIEGFALEADASPLGFDDWKLQMNRILGAVRNGQAILAQTYVQGDQERMYAAGCYLLCRGFNTYLNIELDLDPEWWPEYDIPLGLAVYSAVNSVDDLDPDDNQVYRRDFDNGTVLVNPTNPWDGSGVTRTLGLGASYRLAVGSGGGAVGADGVPTGSLTYQSVASVTLPPYTAAVLLFPAGMTFPGDLDGDGRLTALDFLALRLHLAGTLAQGTPPFTAPLAAADVDRDFFLGAADAAALAVALTASR